MSSVQRSALAPMPKSLRSKPVLHLHLSQAAPANKATGPIVSTAPLTTPILTVIPETPLPSSPDQYDVAGIPLLVWPHAKHGELSGNALRTSATRFNFPTGRPSQLSPSQLLVPGASRQRKNSNQFEWPVHHNS